MAWTTPRTYVSLELVTASILNVDVRDNLVALRASPANNADAYNSGTQVVNGGATDVITLDSEVTDTASLHSTTTNTGRMTIPAGGAGRYLIIGHVQRTSGAGNGRLHLRKNGTTVRSSLSSAENDSLWVMLHIDLVAADYVDMAYEAISNTTTTGSATAAQANRLTITGPLPAA